MSGSAADTWSGGSYERIAETYAPIHDRVVEALAIEPGMRILADVVGIDSSAGQLVKARNAAAAEGLAIQFDEGDCQQLPYHDAAFEGVATAFGAVFAPDHGRTAGELARVCRPGGGFVLTTWPRDEWLKVGDRAGRPSPEGPDATDWAREEHVRGLLGAAFDLELHTGEWRIEAGSGEELWELVTDAMPPLRTWLAEQSDDVRARAAQVYLDYLESGVLARTYVFVLGTRR